MTIYIENTTSPQIIKFVADEALVEGSYEFQTTDEAQNAPLAQQLFLYPFTKKVFITANFIAIEKSNIVEWSDVAEELKEAIGNYLTENHPVVITEKAKKHPISVYIEMTPNPNVMKFVANQVLVTEMIEIKDSEGAHISPLAEELFQFPFIRELFILDNYISITKSKEITWESVSFKLRDYIAQYLQENKSVVRTDWKEIKGDPEYSTTEKEIIAILDEYVIPMVVQDGGNIRLVSFDEETKTAKMLLQGACSGCPSSVITLKEGIENLLKNFFPSKVERVEAIND